MASPEPDADPPSIDPYAVLQVATSASSDEVKKAYRKLALRLHPDKAAPSERDTAHKAFQELAFAYAILSDERRRTRYDATGNTAETLDIDDDDFNWLDFFRAQFAEVVTEEKIGTFKSSYQGSEEERQDVLKGYAAYEGDMGKVFESVMLSNMLEDEERFRGYIDAAIAKGEAESYKAYTEESEKRRKQRMKKARKEAAEAETHLKDLAGKKAEKKDKAKKKGGGGMDDLAALIQQRSAAREAQSSAFLSNLEAKYGGGETTNGKKRMMEEPPEEAFAANRRIKAADDLDDTSTRAVRGKRGSRKKAEA